MCRVGGGGSKKSDEGAADPKGMGPKETSQPSLSSVMPTSFPTRASLTKTSPPRHLIWPLERTCRTSVRGGIAHHKVVRDMAETRVHTDWRWGPGPGLDGAVRCYSPRRKASQRCCFAAAVASGGRMVACLRVRCIPSCLPFCSGCPGVSTMISAKLSRKKRVSGPLPPQPTTWTSR